MYIIMFTPKRDVIKNQDNNYGMQALMFLMLRIGEKVFYFVFLHLLAKVGSVHKKQTQGPASSWPFW
jgi:hypothetical protein